MEAKNGKFTGGIIDLIQENDRENPCFSIAMKNNTQLCKIFPNYLGMYDDYSQGLAGGYIEAITGSEASTVAVYAQGLQYSILGTYGIDTSGDITASGTVHASGFDNTSTIDIKENINKLNIDALNIINNSDLYSFNYKNNKKNQTIGLVIGEGYKTPKEVMSNNDAINMYSMNSLSWKAIQELSQKVTALENEIKELKK